MKGLSARSAQKRAHIRLQQFADGVRRNPRYLELYDLYDRIRIHQRSSKEVIPLHLRDEAWTLLKVDPRMFPLAAVNEGNLFTEYPSLLNQYIAKAFQERFSLRFPANPKDPIMAWTSAPSDVGATVTANGEPVPAIVQTLDLDRGEVPTGQGVVVDLCCSEFVVSHNLEHWHSLSPKERMHCICLDINLRYLAPPDLVADFGLLLPAIKSNLREAFGRKVNFNSNERLLQSFRRMIRLKLPHARVRHRGDEFEKWFLAYDYYTWGMQFEEALKKWGYLETANMSRKPGLTASEVAKKLFPLEWKTASSQHTSEDASPEYRALARKYLDSPYNLTWPIAEEQAAKELGIDTRPRSARTKKLTQRAWDYIQNAQTYVWMPTPVTI